MQNINNTRSEKPENAGERAQTGRLNCSIGVFEYIRNFLKRNKRSPINAMHGASQPVNLKLVGNKINYGFFLFGIPAFRFDNGAARIEHFRQRFGNLMRLCSYNHGAF